MDLQFSENSAENRPLVTLRYFGIAITFIVVAVGMEYMINDPIIDYGTMPLLGLWILRSLLCIPCLLLGLYYALLRIDAYPQHLRVRSWFFSRNIPYTDITGMRYGGAKASQTLVIYYQAHGRARKESIYPSISKKTALKLDQLAGLLQQRYLIPQEYLGKHVRMSAEKPGYFEIKNSVGVGVVGICCLAVAAVTPIIFFQPPVVDYSLLDKLTLVAGNVILAWAGLYCILFWRVKRVWIGPDRIIERSVLNKEKTIYYSLITQVLLSNNTTNGSNSKQMVLFSAGKRMFSAPESSDEYVLLLNALRDYSAKNERYIIGLYD